ncbi:hypothetical protein ERO13_D05G082150v2 [Gossypium hirsutum]|uniref:Uncharacterized protein n=1 Tax=Gossypium darwinii TaxID=34276 RepID=A0A5D2CDA3_GOSDA|nr:hypothetical protein ERO13_D05G082150v2 [Gossypium hirsutum]TYG67567.1 hypothetical protein ES288_D05G086200v1 [Gossypium darwinii]
MDQTMRVTVIALTVLLLRTPTLSILTIVVASCKNIPIAKMLIADKKMSQVTQMTKWTSQLKGKSNLKSNWKLEGELLAAFGKYLKLCMKDVFAPHWQQTSGEKLSKAALCQNQRGFNKIDTCRYDFKCL